MAGLALLAPMLGAAAAAIFLFSGRSPLIAHARVGRYGRRIWVLKLRTMWPAPARRLGLRSVFLAERIDGTHVPRNKKDSDARVTSRFAAFCRRHSIDELPQLWHVVTGEMSFVGPRPITVAEFDRWYGPEAAEMLLWRPGLTGLWQINGRSSLTYAERRRLDLFLVGNWSLPLYFRILFATIPRVITGENAN